MGQNLNAHFTKHQKRFLDLIAQEPYIVETFYLTGGTALSACYLNHRLSEDIDLFSQKAFIGEKVIAVMAKICTKLKAKSELTRIEDLYRYDLTLSHDKLKIDFSWYDFIPLEAPNKLGSLAVDTLADIARRVATNRRKWCKPFLFAKKGCHDHCLISLVKSKRYAAHYPTDTAK